MAFFQFFSFGSLCIPCPTCRSWPRILAQTRLSPNTLVLCPLRGRSLDPIWDQIWRLVGSTLVRCHIYLWTMTTTTATSMHVLRTSKLHNHHTNKRTTCVCLETACRFANRVIYHKQVRARVYIGYLYVAYPATALHLPSFQHIGDTVLRCMCSMTLAPGFYRTQQHPRAYSVVGACAMIIHELYE